MGRKDSGEVLQLAKVTVPTLKGFDKRSVNRMREFYLTEAGVNWMQLVPDNVTTKEIVGLANPQLPAILTRLSWTHHIELLKRTASVDCIFDK